MTVTEAAHAETTVVGDQDAGAVIIEGIRSGTRTQSDSLQPCFDPAAIASATGALRERVIRYLPAQRPGTSPPNGALVNVPLIAFSGQKAVALDAVVLGERVVIELSPTFTWRWGDGRTLTTAEPGRPYPSTAVSHIFRRGCMCTVGLTTAWSGTWGMDGGESFPLGVVLTQQSALRVRVREAPIRLTK